MSDRTARRLAAFALLAMVSLYPANFARGAGALKVERGRIQDFIARLASNQFLLGDPVDDHRPYVDPGPALHVLRHVAQQVAWGDVQEAAELASDVRCEVVEFTDEATDAVYYAVREDRRRLDAIRGWGSYVFKPSGRIDALVEVPHPIADANTRGIGAAVFAAADARGFLLAGAHRDKADVPDMVDSVFHQVHIAWVGPFAQRVAWQIHGFELRKHEFPLGASVVASTGDGAVVPELSHLNAMAEDHGLDTYVFNDLSPESRANRRLNGSLPGVTFTSLAATKNEQGRHSRSLGGTFVHVELETSVRMDRTSRELAASAIADAMRRTAEADRARDESKALLASLASHKDTGRTTSDGYRTRTEVSRRGDDESSEVRLARRSESGGAGGRKTAARRKPHATER